MAMHRTGWNQARSYILGICLTLALFLICAQIVMACRLAPPVMKIEASIDKNLFSKDRSCLDEKCLFALEKNQYGNFALKRTDARYESAPYDAIVLGGVDQQNNLIRFISSSLYMGNQPPINEAAFADALDKIIEEDISQIKPTLFLGVENWLKSREGDLIFTPYTETREAELVKEKNKLLDCSYPEYKRVGNWLVVNYVNRDYCYVSPGNGMSCPFDTISYPQLFIFTIANMGAATAPYLATFIILILGFAIFTAYLIRKKEFWLFWKPSKSKAVLTIIVALLLYIGVSILGVLGEENFWWLVFLFYFISSLSRYRHIKKSA